MNRPLSPIERMIDEACGWRRVSVELECPVCGKTKDVPLRQSDLPGTAKIRFPCNFCPSENAEVEYLDEEGRQIHATSEQENRP